MKRVASSLRRVWYIALNTLREATRQRIIVFLILLALGFVGGAGCFRDFHFGSPELKFIAELGLGAMALFGAMLAVVTTAQLFFSEVEHRTVQTLLAKPVWRMEFILGKFLAVAVITGVFCGLLTVVLAGVLWSREMSLMREQPETLAVGPMIHYANLAALGLLQWLKLLVLAALTLLVASYAATQLFTVVAGCFIFVICHLQHLAEVAATRPEASAVTVIAGLAARIFPDFQLFDLGQTMGASETLPWSALARVTLYAAAYVSAACALAVFNFGRREL